MVAEPRTHIRMMDPTNAVNKRTVQSAVVEGRTLEFRVGDIDGKQHAWTRLLNAQAGDCIWINMTTNGGDTWQEYGHRTIPNPGSRNYTDALQTNSSDQVRMQGWTLLNSGKKYNTASW